MARERRRDLSAADQLDRQLAVTSPRGWIALLSIFAIVGGVCVWSVVGEFSTYVEARGLLLNRDGRVVDASASGRGRLDTVLVEVGDEVERDAVIALIANEELAEQHASLTALIGERKQALEALREALAEEEEIASANNARRRNHLDELEITAREALGVAEDSYDSTNRLYDEGIVSRLELLRSQQEFNQAQRSLIDISRERDSLEAVEVAQKNENAARIRETQAQVQAAERQAAELETLLAAENVLAPESGQIIEVKASPGALVVAGQAVVSIRTGADELDVLLYVPPAASDQVEVGMESLVSPVTVRREEYGAIRGTVDSIASFPVSFDGMVAVLQNENLALTFSENGPPYAGRISLLPDPETASGFVWTSPRASNQTVAAGTLVSVEIKTRSQPPITLAIPLLRELVGI